jgi:hypothetical protein
VLGPPLVYRPIYMRLPAVFVVMGMASACAAQTSVRPPVPIDPYELVTGAGKAQAKDAGRSQALTLLNHAKSFIRLQAPNTPPHSLTVTFTAAGDPANSGTGELNQLWLGVQNHRWTAKFGDYAVARVHIHGEAFDEKPAGIVPMRVHMLRNSIFWAAGTIAADAHFRTAPATWNDKPVTCVLISDRSDPSAAPARRWDESEYCIDDQSGLIQTFSFAPGNYSVYSYAKGQSYHGTPIPDRITTYIAAAMAIDANVRIDEPDTAALPASPTAEMLANGRPISLQDPVRQRMEVHDPKISGETPVMVNAQAGPDGHVAAAEICASADASLNARALELVKAGRFGGGDLQRQVYVEVVFTPASHGTAAAGTEKPASPPVPLESYYLERTTTVPGKATLEIREKDILARRSDGSTVRMNSMGQAENGVFSRDISFIDGREITVYDSIQAKVTWPLRSAGEMQYQRDRVTTGPAECDWGSQSTLIRHDRMEGQDVDVIQFSAGANQVTLWAAPKLGCEYLRDKAEAPNRDGTFRIDLEVKTTKLVIGEPDPRLFDVATGLTEMKPSEALRKLWSSTDMGLSDEVKTERMRGIEREGALMDIRYQAKGQ